MKIAIFHNLEKGGALNFLIFVSKYLKNKNQIDVYCLNKVNFPKNCANNFYVYHLKKTDNIISHLIQIFFELRKINKKIAKNINSKNYDLILIFPCILTQSPYILRYIESKTITLYFFNEPKREFYEKTSFDYLSLKKMFTRLLRLPIKYIDKFNCKKAKNIISNSFFTSNNLLNIYNKKSFVIYPGLKTINPRSYILKNHKNLLSVGLLSKIKGHDFSIQQISSINPEITILGRKSDESEKIINLAKKKNVKLTIVNTEINSVKNNLYKNYSFFLANQLNEPFGITTLEAISNNCFVLGKNTGGTSEIVFHGLNGFLYPDNLALSRTILKRFINLKHLNTIKFYKIDWETTTNKILYIYNYLKHEPTK